MLRPYLELPRQVHILCLGSFINRAGTFLLVFLTLYLEEKLSLGVATATLAMGAAGAGGLAAGPVGGHLADRYGRRRVMLLALLGGAAILLFFSTLNSGPAIVVTLFVLLLVSEMYRPAAGAMIADLVSPEQRTHAFALMYVSINLGFAVAPILGSWLAGHSYRLLYGCDALTTVLYALLILATVRETLPSLRGAETGPARGEENSVDLITAAKRIVRDYTFMRFSLGALFVALVFVQSMATMPLYMRGLGLGRATYGWVIAVNGALIVLLQLPVTVVVVRFPRGMMLILSALLYAVGFGLVGVCTTAWQFAVTVIIWTLGEMVQAPLLSAIVSDLAPVELRARYMGVLSMTFALGMTLGAPLGGAVLQWLGGSYLWGCCFGAGLVGLMLYASIHARIDHARTDSALNAEPVPNAS